MYQPHLIRLYLTGRAIVGELAARARASAERGEGVISAAIAVLIVAFLGAAAWIAFKGIFDNASNKAENQVNQIGG